MASFVCRWGWSLSNEKKKLIVMPSTMRLSSRFYCFEAPNELVDVVRKDIIHLCAFFSAQACSCLSNNPSKFLFSVALFPPLIWTYTSGYVFTSWWAMMMILDQDAHEVARKRNKTTIKNVCNYICCHRGFLGSYERERKVGTRANNLFDGFSAELTS